MMETNWLAYEFKYKPGEREASSSFLRRAVATAAGLADVVRSLRQLPAERVV